MAIQWPMWPFIMLYGAKALQIVPSDGASGLPGPDAAMKERLRELTDFQLEVLREFYDNISSPMLVGNEDSCAQKPFRMFMPAHTATCTTLATLVATLKNVGVSCGKSAGQGHEHNALANSVIKHDGWTKFNTTISFVMAKDPWSRVRSAAAWFHVGINDSLTDEENIAAFRQSLLAWTGGGHHLGALTYLHSITDYSHAVPPGKTEKQQVVTYVGRVARLGESIRHVCGLLGIPADKCVDPDSKSIRSHRITTQEGKRRPRTVDFYDDETRGIVAKLWEEDIKNFGFKFGEL